MWKSFLFLVLLHFSLEGLGKPLNSGTSQINDGVCGYESCKRVDSSTLNVHMIPHSHDDVGWLKTVSQYYYGSKTLYQRAGVQYIISSVVEALQQNPERRFIQVETAFFIKWWNYQNEETKAVVQKLVNNGQLEIIGGGWSMNDEAATHYQSTIDQFTLGLRMINDTLGECGRPKIGWQIDPFGHSREMASIFSHLGFDAFFVGRADYRDKSLRFDTQTAEMIWDGSDSLGESSNIFTSILYNNYAAPPGFCFDILCTDDPIVDEEGSPEYNYESKVNAFAEYVRKQADSYNTSNIIITMGEDFQYQDAFSYFYNMDKLLEGFHKFPQTYNYKAINIFYSTPSCYVKAVNDEAIARQLKFPVKTDDFFPYASDPHAYWTGYFSSRPTSKRFERQGNNLLQVAKQLSALNANNADKLQPLKEAMGIMQHHDAITGTEKQHVADDYHRILSKAVVETTDASSIMISNLLQKNNTDGIQLNLKSCLLANVSYCPESAKKQFVVTVYNPLSRNVSHYVHLPVNSTDFTIIGPNGEEVPYQITDTPRNFNYTNLGADLYTLVFYASNIPPLGLQIYHITNYNPTSVRNIVAGEISEKEFRFGDDTSAVEIDIKSGKLKSLTIRGITLEVNQELMYYYGAKGNNSQTAFRSSGAYIFRPDEETPQAVPITETVSARTYRGPLFDEVHQIFNEWAVQVIRVYKNAPYVEFDWIVGPLGAPDNIGKEVISRFTTNVKSGDTFYTDSNGREMLKRLRNNRLTYNYTDEEPVSSNYYPVTSRVVIKDDEYEFSVLNDRAQGGSSLSSGTVELMIQRRCMNDDAFGVGENLYEWQYNQGLVARGQHYVTFGPVSGTEKSIAAIQRDIAQQKILAPWVFVAEASNLETLQQKINFEYAGLTTSLPENVQILTLEPWKDGKILLRLDHILEAEDDPVLSKIEVVNLQGLFREFEILSLRETTLAANQWLEDNKRLEWTVGDRSIKEQTKTELRDDDDDIGQFKITLAPMQIRTFIADIKYNN